jgi:predicted nucleotide-binding protein
MRPSKAKAIEILQKELDAIPSLTNHRATDPEYQKWARNVKVAILYIFGDNSDHINDFGRIRFSIPRLTSAPISDSANQRTFSKGLNSAKSILESMIEEIESFWSSENVAPDATALKGKQIQTAKEVFIVHGHDAGSKETVARFITSLGLTPIILHEQPNQGRTIIEKIEKHAQASFALALLTPDDHGSLAGIKTELKPRARQNVIFEFGFFIGLLGRDRVCALTKGDIELPSDYDGVLYVPLDEAGSWKMTLVREIKAAGCDVDTNRAFL